MQLEAFCCPRCKSAKLKFQNSEREIVCGECEHVVPSFDKLYCFSAFPKAYQTQWQARYTNALASFADRQKQLTASLKDDHPPLTKTRLDRVLASQKKNLERILQFLPELLTQKSNALAMPLAEIAATKVSRLLGFDSFHANIFRDWVWGEAENAAAFSLLKSYVAPSDRFVAVLGSGCGRLATDLATDLALNSPNSEVYAAEINPLFARFHQMMTEASAQPVEFDEIPVNPRSLEHVTITQRLKPKPCANVFALLMNGLSPAFRKGSLDVIVASWFIDVVPEDFARLAARLNSALKIDGKLIVHGPLGFSNSSEPRAYTPEEIGEILELKGYKIEQQKRVEADYLNSEFNPQKRREELKLIVARKVKNVKEPSEFHALPEWLEQTNRPIPLESAVTQIAQQARLRYEIFASIDGKKSFDDIALALERQYKLTHSDAQNIMAMLVAEIFER